MTGTDMVIFRRAEGDSAGQSAVPWPDPWPPPPRLCMVNTMTEAGRAIAIINPDEQDEEGRETLRNAGPAVIWMTRLNVSEQPEPAPEGEHWFRGAEYVPATITSI